MVEKKVSGLEDILKKNKSKKFLLVSHVPHCPDGIASFFAMEKICNHHKIKAKMYWVKSAMLPENVALLNKLDLKIDYMENGEVDAKKYDKIVFLDCVPGASNVPEINKTNFDDDIVIDHHEIKQGKKIKGKLVDIRQDVGSTSTILAHYLEDFGLLKKDNDEDATLAELLWYGIRTDTQKFNESKLNLSDLCAMIYLWPFCKGKLAEATAERKIARADWPIFMEVYNEHSKNRVEKISYLFINAGKVSGIQSLAKAAEYALRNEGIDISILVGLNPEGNIVASSRSRDPAKSSNDVITAMFGKYGGGTWSSAAATYPLKAKLEEVSDGIPFMKGSDVEEDYNIQIVRIRKTFEEYVEPKKKKIKTEEKEEKKKGHKSKEK